MLPAASMSLGVYRDQVFGKAPASALLIDCSTIDVGVRATSRKRRPPRAMRWSTRRFRAGSPRRRGGTLAFMVGGSDEAFERARPILEPMAKAVIHAGGAGAGQAAKICNNMILGATMVVTCEAFVLAAKARARSQGVLRHLLARRRAKAGR